MQFIGRSRNLIQQLFIERFNLLRNNNHRDLNKNQFKYCYVLKLVFLISTSEHVNSITILNEIFDYLLITSKNMNKYK